MSLVCSYLFPAVCLLIFKLLVLYKHPKLCGHKTYLCQSKNKTHGSGHEVERLLHYIFSPQEWLQKVSETLS